MTWTDVKIAHRQLADCVVEGKGTGKDATEAWLAFCATATQGAEHVPYHMEAVFRLLDEIGQGKERGDIVILDHGCGGCLTLLYLLANGYTGIHGVDIGGALPRWQAFLQHVVGLEGDRLYLYDGTALPFGDQRIDLIFSDQVIEHIRPNVLQSFYSEERRVLRPGGAAFHRVPHRLAPYDSHTRTWFLHYLPRALWLRLLRLIGRSSVTAETALFLRWPWVHRRLVRRYLGNYEDQTVQRFADQSDLSHYEGPKGLRRAVAGLLRTPVLGPIARAVVRNIGMIDTVSRRSV